MNPQAPYGRCVRVFAGFGILLPLLSCASRVATSEQLIQVDLPFAAGERLRIKTVRENIRVKCEQGTETSSLRLEGTFLAKAEFNFNMSGTLGNYSVAKNIGELSANDISVNQARLGNMTALDLEVKQPSLGAFDRSPSGR